MSIQMLGAFQVSVGERIVDPGAWRLRKATQLIKLLALTPGHRLHRDQLIDALWPEDDPDSALSSFHQALHAARRALEPDRAARSAESLLQLQHQVLSLAPVSDLWIDLEAFQAAAARGRSANDLDACLAGLHCYAGDLLPEELYEGWTQRARDSLRGTYLDLLLTTARLQEASGAFVDAIETLRTLVNADQLNEAAYASLMRLHAVTGRRDQALRLYQQLSDLLREELDADPSPELSDLFARISAGELTATDLGADQPATRPRTPQPETSRLEQGDDSRILLAELARQDGLFDRRAELDLLQRSFDALWSGEGQIVLLAGEPGIGKTRLAEEFAHFAELRGAAVLWARCHEADGTPAFWPWLQIVRGSLRNSSAERLRAELGPAAGPIAQVVPDVLTLLPDTPVPSQLDSGQARFRFFDSLSSFLTRLAKRDPLILIIDDLHWADRSSLLLLEFLADEVAATRIMLVGTYRDTDAVGNVPLTRALERLNRSRVTHRIQLTGFAMHDTALFGEFIAGKPLPEHLVATIYQRTSGNPFFAREVVRLLSSEGTERDQASASWSGPVPVGVREAVTLRLERVSEEARLALVHASVIGVSFQLDILAEVMGTPDDRLLGPLEQAIALGVIAEDLRVPDQFQFTHVLVQQTLYEGLIAARRSRLHARVGDAIERLRGATDDPPYAELAEHFYLSASAGEADRAVRYLAWAGEQSMQRLAYAEAASQFRCAVDVLDRFMPDQTFELSRLLMLLGRAQLDAGDANDARGSFLRSVQVARDGGDAETMATAIVEMMNVSSVFVDWRAGEETALLEEALSSLPTGDSPLRSRVMSRLAHAMALDKSHLDSESQRQRRELLTQEAIAMARRVGTPELIADALRAAYDVLWTAEDIQPRIEVGYELLSIAKESNRPQLELSARAQLIGEYLTAGNLAEVDRQIDAYEEVAKTYHLPFNLWSITAKRAMRALIRGQLRECEQLMDRAHQIGLRAAPESSRLNYLFQLFFLRREQGRHHELEAVIRAEADHHTNEPFWRCLLALLYADSGRSTDASVIMRDLLADEHRAIPRDSFWLASLALLAEACSILRDSSHAAGLMSSLRSHATLFISPGNNIFFLGTVSHYLGLLATVLEQWDDAVTYFEASLEAGRFLGSPICQASVECAYAEMLLRRGEGGGHCKRLLESARQMANRDELTRVALRVQALANELAACHSS